VRAKPKKPPRVKFSPWKISVVAPIGVRPQWHYLKANLFWINEIGVG